MVAQGVSPSSSRVTVASGALQVGPQVTLGLRAPVDVAVLPKLLQGSAGDMNTHVLQLTAGVFSCAKAAQSSFTWGTAQLVARRPRTHPSSRRLVMGHQWAERSHSFFSGQGHGCLGPLCDLRERVHQKDAPSLGFAAGLSVWEQERL